MKRKLPAKKLIVKARADLDIAGHYVYLLGRSAEVAARFRKSVKAAKQRIRQDPRSCATLALPGLKTSNFASVAEWVRQLSGDLSGHR